MSSGSIYVVGGSGLSTDDLRSLRHWMIEVYDLGGRVDLRQADPRPGELGSVTDALVVAAGSGGVLTSMVGALVSWLRHRTSDVTLTLTRADGSSMELEGRRVRGLDAEDLGALIDRLATQLAPAAAEPDTETRA